MALPFYRQLANGIILELADEAKGSYVRAACSWLVEIPSGHPEPDSYADTIKIVDCGAPLVEADDDGWRCANGHSHYVAWSERGRYQELQDAHAERNHA